MTSFSDQITQALNLTMPMTLYELWVSYADPERCPANDMIFAANDVEALGFAEERVNWYLLDAVETIGLFRITNDLVTQGLRNRPVWIASLVQDGEQESPPTRASAFVA